MAKITTTLKCTVTTNYFLIKYSYNHAITEEISYFISNSTTFQSCFATPPEEKWANRSSGNIPLESFKSENFFLGYEGKDEEQGMKCRAESS